MARGIIVAGRSFADGTPVTNEMLRQAFSLGYCLLDEGVDSLTESITDPGDAGAIPVSVSGSCPLVTTGAETRTLSDPDFEGEVLALSMRTDGGDCVVTASNAINQTGNTTITFDDAGDTIVLYGIYVGSNLRWRVMSSDGVTLGS